MGVQLCREAICPGLDLGVFPSTPTESTRISFSGNFVTANLHSDTGCISGLLCGAGEEKAGSDKNPHTKPFIVL